MLRDLAGYSQLDGGKSRARDPASMTIKVRAIHVIDEAQAARVVHGVRAVKEANTAAVFSRVGMEDSTSTVGTFTGSGPRIQPGWYV